MVCGVWTHTATKKILQWVLNSMVEWLLDRRLTKVRLFQDLPNMMYRRVARAPVAGTRSRLDPYIHRQTIPRYSNGKRPDC